MEGLPDEDRLNSEADINQALSEPIRLRILYALNKCNMCPCLLKEMTALSDSKLSYHLNILEKANLIRSFPQKKWRIYTITEMGRTKIVGPTVP